MSSVVAIDTYDGNDIASISAYLEQNVYPYLETKGFRMLAYFGSLATPDYVGPAAAKEGVSLLTGTGHGTYTTFEGYQGQDLFAVGSYTPEQVSGKIVHFLSCENAKQLGPDFVRNGCLAYIGYDENFIFNPAFSDSFYNCDAEILRALADGLTVAEAVKRAKNLYSQTIASLMAAGDAASMDAAHQMQYNLQHLRSPLDGDSWGRGEAKLS
jgi:hypothetical protein